jgi:uncharacterized protein (UPF0332 family)
MQGRDFLDVAKNLCRSQIEASLRSAISRAYYALLNTAAQLLMGLGFSMEQGPGVHGQVRNRFFNCGIEQLGEFSSTLDELRRQRNEADCNMKSKEFQSQAICTLRVAKAEAAIGLLTDCDKEPLRSQIRAGIREYERKIGLHS